jgi:excisionase family DNA binding protein
MKGTLMETFTVEEIAKYLKLHEYTIRRLARDGKIPSFKAGGQWRFDKSEIEQWRKEQSKTRSTKNQ